MIYILTTYINHIEKHINFYKNGMFFGVLRTKDIHMKFVHYNSQNNLLVVYVY